MKQCTTYRDFQESGMWLIYNLLICSQKAEMEKLKFGSGQKFKLITTIVSAQYAYIVSMHRAT